MTEDVKKSRYSFDLSDGFGKEDIRAIFSGIWGFIVGILKIIFWPYVWISRVIGRSVRFIRVKATDNPLSSDERAFIESIPGFFIISGMIRDSSSVYLFRMGVPRAAIPIVFRISLRFHFFLLMLSGINYIIKAIKNRKESSRQINP